MDNVTQGKETLQSCFMITLTGKHTVVSVFQPREALLLGAVSFGGAAVGAWRWVEVGGGGRRCRSTCNNTQSWSLCLWK